jgi:GxxExxY protein
VDERALKESTKDTNKHEVFLEVAMPELLFKDEVFAIIGAAIEVHKELGSGFLEPVYQEALELESKMRGLPYNAQQTIIIHYKGILLKKEYVPDFVFYDKIIVEIKALDNLTGKEESQLLNHLKATGYKIGLLINFGSRGKLEWKRLIF